jgi:pseudo-rSAM protein
MNIENKKKWFSLSPSVFIWRKKEKCLFYDSNTFRSKLFHINTSSVNDFINELQNIDNLYCIDVTEKPDEKVVSFLRELVNLKMGMVVNEKATQGQKPIQLPPILNLQSAVERLDDKEITDLAIGENILEYVHEVHIILDKNQSLGMMQAIIDFIDTLRKSNLYGIRISGYVPALSRSTSFGDFLSLMPALKTIVLEFNDDILDILLSIKELNIENVNILIQVRSIFSKDLLYKVEDFLQSKEINHEYEFLVANEQTVDSINPKIQDIDSKSVNLNPFFDDKNHDFFENNIYLDENDIQNMEMTKKNIFAHQALNTNDFGKLTITPDGKVYANPYFPALGTIEDDIRLLVYKEMIDGASWRRVRDMQPCCDCVYQWLCPSPSNYEIVIDRPNLCHIYP